jgi:quinol monooxygenase YgiN
MLHVIAIITAKPGQRDTVLAAFKSNVPLVHQEAGCIEYTPVIDLDGTPGGMAKLGPDAFMVVERWESQAALEAHAASAHMAAYGAKVKDLLASRTIYVLNPV